MVRHEDTAPMQEQAIHEAPWLFQVSSIKSLPKELSIRCGRGGPMDVVEEGESGPRADAERRPSEVPTASSWSASRRDRASAMVLRRPRWYSAVKSKPKSLLIH
jgi:hypothetical protein